jgi:hypothetical protein
MHLTNNADYAIQGTTVSGFTFSNSLIDGTNGNTAGNFEGSVYFQNLTGSASITNAVITGGFYNNFTVKNDSATPLNRITFNKTQTGSTNVNNNDNINFEALVGSSAVINVTVQNSVLTAAAGDLFQYANNGNAATGDLVITNSQFTNNHPAIGTGGGGVTLNPSGNMTFHIDHSTFRDAVGHAILIVKDVSTNTVQGTFDNNVVGVAATANSGSKEGSDLKIQQAGDGTVTVAVTNNQFFQYNNDALLLQTGAGVVKGGNFNAIVTGNTMSNAGNNPSIGVPVQGVNLNGGVTPGDTFSTCAQIGGAGTLKNDLDSAIGPFGGGDYRLRQRQSTTVRLPGYGGAATDTAAVTAFVNAANTVSGSGTATVNSPPGGGFVGGAACSTPSTAPAR